MDWIPVVSQVKSMVQLIAGDAEGAAKTQENFVNQCPIISQVKTVSHLVAGDVEKADETVKSFCENANNVLDSVPVVGHVKGVCHLITGDLESAKTSMQKATRSIGVTAGGVVGFAAGGPVGAAAGGITGGLVYDEVVDSEHKFSNSLKHISNKIKSDQNVSGDVFDVTSGLILDGLTGVAGGNGVKVKRLTLRSASRKVPLKVKVPVDVSVSQATRVLASVPRENTDDRNNEHKRSRSERRSSSNGQTRYENRSYSTNRHESSCSPDENNNHESNEDEITIDPCEIRFSQSYITDTNACRSVNYDEPFDVVLMPDGKLTSIDNKRLLSARETVTSIKVCIHKFDDPLPRHLYQRFHIFSSSTWGMAVMSLIEETTSNECKNNNPYGWYNLLC